METQGSNGGRGLRVVGAGIIWGSCATIRSSIPDLSLPDTLRAKLLGSLWLRDVLRTTSKN